MSLSAIWRVQPQSKKIDENSCTGSTSCSPVLSQQEEILSALVDTVWPDIVDSLVPLVERVLKCADDCNISYNADAECTMAQDDQQMDEKLFL